MELAMGLFLAGSIAALFAAFPSAIIGAMMLLVGIEMTRFARDVRWDWNLAPLLMTVLVSLLFNMAVGFLAGLLLHYVLLRWLSRLPSRKAGP